tara:strand:- start:621 stop:1877 length:1257 start_codon:yes stop_codon:yes gene_type:complete
MCPRAWLVPDQIAPAVEGGGKEEDEGMPPLTAAEATPPLSVTGFLESFRSLIKCEPKCRVAGELSGVHLHRSGHLYFDLKDGASTLRCAYFRFPSKEQPREGRKVVVEGKADLYTQRGAFQLIASRLEEAGDQQGELSRRRGEIIQRLTDRGLVDRPRAPLPFLPSHIAIVTSPESAACADMLAEQQKRFPDFRVTVCGAAVQGEGAPASILGALRRACALQPSVIIVARGGGSAEDLGAFDSEELAEFVAGSGVCVVSAIGHETDHPILDLVADHRAKTPTAAMQMVLPQRDALCRRLEGLRAGIHDAAFTLLGALPRRVRRASATDAAQSRLHGLAFHLATRRERAVGAVHAQLATVQARMKERVASLPHNYLARGLCLATDTHERAIRSAEGARAAKRIRLTFVDGTVDAVIGGG